MKLGSDLVKKAYKKLKSSVYFDKTQLILRDQIVKFESETTNFDSYLEQLWECFLDTDKWNTLQEQILGSIRYISYPKKLKQEKETIIINSVTNSIEIEDVQYLIEMNVEGHIFGVIWLLLIGWQLDKLIYEHSYGNRMRKKLLNEISSDVTFSPYLFEPYFEQYESWRDTALNYAKKCLSKNQDVIVITMDLAKFYYSIDMTQDTISDILSNHITLDEKDRIIFERINDYIYKVINSYASLFDDRFDRRRILPIGFLPSNVLANWSLNCFDKAVSDGWNPTYYGRYVDDILVVDKIEKNSDIYSKAKNQILTKQQVIEFFMEQCSKWKGFLPNCKNPESWFALLLKDECTCGQSNTAEPEEIVYKINPIYYLEHSNNSSMKIQNQKVNIFYFKHGESEALIDCFRNKIQKNKSEFRYMPEDEAIFQSDDYSEIYDIELKDSVNKLRGVKGISIDKFVLSKFLGKYLRIGGLIKDKVESKFELDILKIFNGRVIIENFTTWEKIIEIFIINEKYDALNKFVVKIVDSIFNIKFDTDIQNIQKTLLLTLRSAIARSISLNLNQKTNEFILEVYKNVESKFLWLIDSFRPEYIQQHKKDYCFTRMVDKYVMPILIDAFLDIPFFSFQESYKINLSDFYSCLDFLNKFGHLEYDLSSYQYYPYLITMFDLSIYTSIVNMANDNGRLSLEQVFDIERRNYTGCNYCNHENYMSIDSLVQIHKFSQDDVVIKIGNETREKLKIAIANVNVSAKNFELLVRDRPNRSYRRYKELSQVINLSIQEKADLIVLPECYTPYEWLSILARTSAKNQLGIITGVEHVKVNNSVYNLTAVILPYIEDGFKCSHISFHLKNHYAPGEEQEILGYRLSPMMGEGYELYYWKDCWFPVYCCYELASINDRSIFQSYSDLLVAVEYNTDVNYYSNILESLSRDLHCYCIQVNSSIYGDSRITKPSKTEEKDIIRTKGGTNSTILVDEIDITKLRDFQLKEFQLQKADGSFKPTPPDFDPTIVKRKINHILWEYIKTMNDKG